MNKNLIIVLLIFLLPLCIYWGLTKDKSLISSPSIAYSGPEIIKFYSPMCGECVKLEKIMNEVYPKYATKVNLKEIDVTQRNSETWTLIKKYEVRVVPTTVFFTKSGKVTKRVEGTMNYNTLENYIKEIING